MAQQPLKRLRWFCLLLAAVLGSVLALLAWSTHRELAEQKRLRHQVVAERVLDEMERELSLLLLREQQRPAYASVESTHPDTWAPFVVGYFTRQGDQTRLLAQGQLDAERRERLLSAADRWLSSTAAMSKGHAHEELDEEAREDDAAEKPWLGFGRGVGAEREETAAPLLDGIAEEAPSATSSADGFSHTRQKPPARRSTAISKASKRKSNASASKGEPFNPPAKPSSPQVLRRLNRGQEQRPQPARATSKKKRARSKDPMQDYEYGF